MASTCSLDLFMAFISWEHKEQPRLINSRSMRRMGNTLAHGVSHFCIRMPKRYGGLGSSKSCSDWKEGLM
ncbi:hypothetical protein EYF80_001295 [Liparis tanakae]|uniref:Uncharacterized protein n=1 Tax=Liparis tanakae TaxID=230148 RepID=A0A4Z2JGZ2_9TELE|nr:hypothetical protein EYF80_001295 [Liparis tanakae]